MSIATYQPGITWMIRPEHLVAMSKRTGKAPDLGLVPGQGSDGRPEDPDGGSGRRRRPAYNVQAGVAIIPVYGPIYRHSTYVDDYLAFLFGGTSIDSLADAIRTATADASVKSILLTFDSPGGMASGVGELASMIRRSASVKPVASYVESQCCSAALYLASATGEIWAAPTAFVGSLGAVCVMVDDSGFQEQVGVKLVPIVSAVSPDKWPDPATPEGRAVVQAEIDALGKVFVADVAKYRGVTVATALADFGRGASLIADDARKAGLIDRVGTIEDAVLKLAGPGRGRLAKASPTSPQEATPVPGAMMSDGQAVQPIRVRLRAGFVTPV